ncbi:pyridoxal phosphate-dependent aminotransferase [Loigolactobacillus jiayinensis]|uniref:Aminotransferase n=1 Tax=Loigolactobacillus jiayinensis TaxID=2486016 RepID=A0ABW1RE89_9LACO|nr:threonine-phosphate decarboxylase [Loigolactobacillus jiayinensis]
MKVAHHGGNLAAVSRTQSVSLQQLVDFSANINPLGLAPELRQLLTTGLDELTQYPDTTYFTLRTQLSQHFQVPVDWVFVGNGAVQLLFDVAATLAIKNVLLLAPAFAEYERAFTRIGATVTYFDLQPEQQFRIDVAALIETLRQQPEIEAVCLGNPNNPTGQVLSRQAMQQLRAYCQQQHIWLLVDEAFMDFLPDAAAVSLVPTLQANDCVVIVRSATKFFAIPGLRLGYAIVPHVQLGQRLLAYSEPWALNSLADIAGQHIYQLTDYIQQTRHWFATEQPWLQAQLVQIPQLKVFPSQVNYILFWAPLTDLATRLVKLGIVIRTCGDYRQLDEHYYRVAVKDHGANLRLLAALNQVLNQ